MQKDHSELHERHARVQQLCGELLQLVSLSREQRRRLDALLSELDALRQLINEQPFNEQPLNPQPLVKRAGKR